MRPWRREEREANTADRREGSNPGRKESRADPAHRVPATDVEETPDHRAHYDLPKRKTPAKLRSEGQSLDKGLIPYEALSRRVWRSDIILRVIGCCADVRCKSGDRRRDFYDPRRREVAKASRAIRKGRRPEFMSKTLTLGSST